MPAPVVVACPHCKTSLKLKDRNKLGQRITCPKCKKAFKAELTPDDEDEFGELARSNRDIEEEELPPPRRPAPVQRAGAAKGKPGSQRTRGASSGSKVPLIIGGSVALLALVG